MTETRSLKVSQHKRTTLEVEIHRNPAQDESPVAFGTEMSEKTRPASELIPVEQGPDFAISTGSQDREEMSVFLIEKIAVECSPTGHTNAIGVRVSGYVFLVLGTFQEHSGCSFRKREISFTKRKHSGNLTVRKKLMITK